MAYGIVIGNQKGGVSKTTTTGLLGWFLSESHRVLLVDFDMQSNLTKMYTRKGALEFKGKSAFEAIVKEQADPFIVRELIPGRTLDILPASENLALFKANQPSDLNRLHNALKGVQDQYDVILFDTPPALGDHLLASWLAADGVINLTMTHEYAVDGSISFVNRLKDIRQAKPSLKLIGVAVAIFENTSTHRKIADQLKSLYKDLMFDSFLYKRSAISRMNVKNLPTLKSKAKEALEHHKKLAEEVLQRVGQLR